MEVSGKSGEKEGIKRAVIGEDFSQTVLALTEEILPAGHIALAFAQEDTALANRTEAALNLQKYKIGRYSYASGTTPSREAAEDLENCPESVRLLICCGEADMADIVKFIKKAQELGLYVILRPGPYICAEWDLGGLPAWILADKNVALRCMTKPYLSYVE